MYRTVPAWTSPPPVCDDCYTLSALFGSPVPDRCRTSPGSQFGPQGTPPGSPKDHPGIPKVPPGTPKGDLLVQTWCQFGPGLGSFRFPSSFPHKFLFRFPFRFLFRFPTWFSFRFPFRFPFELLFRFLFNISNQVPICNNC